MTTTEFLHSEQNTNEFKELFKRDYGALYLLPEKNIMICELTTDYVPIEEFKEIFLSSVPFIDQYDITKFIFDKQHLRIFHQPSMEWYYIEWKKDMYEKGLVAHRKIMPQDQPQFAAAVEAGKNKIQTEHPDLVIPKLDIQYNESVKDAIEH